MSNSQVSRQTNTSNYDSYELSCEIRFLSESVPAWIKEHASSGISAHNDDAAYGLELIMSAIADKVMGLNENLPGQGGQGND